jgi:hypothetical protein
MGPTFGARPAAARVTGAILIASGVVFAAGVLPQPRAIADLYALDTLTEAYAVVDAHASAYTWGNIVAGLGAVLALIGVWRLHRRPGHRQAVERIAIVGLAAATLGWLVEIAVRVSIIVERADGSSASGTGAADYLADHALEGDGTFLVVSLVYSLALLVLAVALAREHVVGRVATGILVFSTLASATLVQSDPVAITFLPPFTFWLGLPAIGISLLWGNRASAELTSSPSPASR